jgi:spoIIIJ-associated protein
MLDIAGFRAARRAEVSATADSAIEKARGGDRVALSPMNAFERKIVHDAVAAAGLVSTSEGEEPGRYVVITSA